MSRLITPSELSREVLVEIVSRLQSLLYLDMDRNGREFWNPAKEWGGADVCQDIQCVLYEYGLVPGEEQDCVPTTTESPPTSTAALVAWVQSQGLGPEDLDDEIHDQVSVLASSLNNRGLSAQIEFLVGQFGAVETRKLLVELVSDKAPRGTTP